MNDTIFRFKNLFLSPKNSKHILELVLSKIDVDQLPLRERVLKYERILFELQNYIFDNFFSRPSDGNIELESSLISLNKITISKLKQYIEQDIQSIHPSNNIQTNYQPTIIIPTTTDHQMSTPINKLSESKLVNISDIHEANKNVVTQFHNFFSTDAKLENGRYTFPFQLPQVTAVSLNSFKLDCNMYNITESNNKFVISEMDTHVPCNIPIGYYTNHELLECIEKLLNTNSRHNYEYTVTRNKPKNKVYIQCNKTFNIYFNSSLNTPIPLQTLLGFTKLEYMNNNTYVSELQPRGNIFDELYIKLFVNEKEVTKYFTTKNNFSYFHSLHLEYEDYFGRRYFCIPTQQDYFECSEELSIDNLSVELWHTPDRPYTRHLDFDLVLSFES